MSTALYKVYINGKAKPRDSGKMKWCPRCGSSKVKETNCACPNPHSVCLNCREIFFTLGRRISNDVY